MKFNENIQENQGKISQKFQSKLPGKCKLTSIISELKMGYFQVVIVLMTRAW